jgi:hypothetical protein
MLCEHRAIGPTNETGQLSILLNAIVVSQSSRTPSSGDESEKAVETYESKNEGKKMMLPKTTTRTTTT